MVSTAKMGVWTMNKQSENKTSLVKNDQKKPKPTKVELNEQELDEVAGGAGKVTFNPYSITRKMN
jgi:hypothetical protein